jgi:hypothetical protein
MAANPSLSQAFLTDLAEIHASLQPQTPALSPAFLSDLERVYASLPHPSDENLAYLAERFKQWRQRTRKTLAGLLKALHPDDPVLCQISLFRTMDVGRLETAHTRTLAWLLDKDKEHGFGDALLAALLQRLAKPDRFDCLHVEAVDAEVVIGASSVQSRLDVLAKGQWEYAGERTRWMLVIEAKVGAREGKGQLGSYDEWIHSHAAGRRMFRVFLTPNGDPPESGSEEWEPLRFLELVQVFQKVYYKLKSKPGFHFLRFYLAGVLQDICGWPRKVTADGPDPYTIVAYLKSVRTAQRGGKP